MVRAHYVPYDMRSILSKGRPRMECTLGGNDKQGYFRNAHWFRALENGEGVRIRHGVRRFVSEVLLVVEVVFFLFSGKEKWWVAAMAGRCPQSVALIYIFRDRWCAWWRGGVIVPTAVIVV